MNRIIIAVLALALSSSALSQTNIRTLWLTMPDSLLPYMNQNMRKDHLDFYDMKVRSEVRNILEGSSIMDSLSTDYLSINMNQNQRIQLKVLTPSVGTDTLLCMIRTFLAPECESEVTFFNTTWQRKSDSYSLPLEHEADSLIDHFIFQPETIPANRYAELREKIDFIMLSAQWDTTADALILTVSVPMLNKEEVNKFSPLILQRKFKWVGNKFKEC